MHFCDAGSDICHSKGLGNNFPCATGNVEWLFVNGSVTMHMQVLLEQGYCLDLLCAFPRKVDHMFADMRLECP